jgi:ribosomal-protein-alanine N-acetyltransferase
VADELHIGNIAVAPAVRRRGIGRRILEHCLDDARARGIEIATLEVRVSNDPAIALYEKLGFRPVAMRRGYYSDTGEDALVMMASFEVGEEGSR